MSVGRILQAGGTALGLTLSSAQLRALERYIEITLSWRRRLNLTGVGTPEAAAEVLVLDALACLAPLPHRGSIIDLGSGAGTPGVPIAVVCPELRVLLVEASRKKAGFLEVVLRELGLVNADVLHTRAETLGRDPAHRERYDAVTARAVAGLPVLVELALPLLRVGGVGVFPKEAEVAAEVGRASAALRVLGGAAEVRGRLAIVRKIAPTPAAYPRRPGVPARRPLGPRRVRRGGAPAI